MSADDGIRAHDPVLDIGKVHRTTLALAEAVGPTEEFPEASRHGSPAGESMSVSPVGGQSVVVWTKSSRESYSHRLLTDAKMSRAVDDVAQEQLIDLLFEPADFQHLPVLCLGV